MPSISNVWELGSVKHTSLVWIFQLNVLRKILNEISNNYPYDLYVMNVCKTVESCWSVLLKRLQWNNTASVIYNWGTLLLSLSIAVFYFASK